MGVIQGSINSLLGTAGVGIRLSPLVEELREVRNLKKDIAKTEELDKKAQEKPEEYADIAEGINKRLAGSYSELARLRPTEENIRAYSAHEGAKELFTPEYMERENALIRSREALKAEQERARMGRDFRSNTPEFVEMFTEKVPTNDILARQKFIKEGK